MKFSYEGEFRRALGVLSKKVPDNIGFEVNATKHFVERFVERHKDGYLKGSIDVFKKLDSLLPLLIYFSKLDTILPDRGRISLDGYEIRCNVIDWVVWLNTFIDRGGSEFELDKFSYL